MRRMGVGVKYTGFHQPAPQCHSLILGWKQNRAGNGHRWEHVPQPGGEMGFPAAVPPRKLTVTHRAVNRVPAVQVRNVVQVTGVSSKPGFKPRSVPMAFTTYAELLVHQGGWGPFPGQSELRLRARGPSALFSKESLHFSFFFFFIQTPQSSPLTFSSM